MKLKQNNLGKVVTLLGGREVTISKILANREAFRIKEEENASTVNDYPVTDIVAADGLVVDLYEE